MLHLVLLYEVFLSIIVNNNQVFTSFNKGTMFSPKNSSCFSNNISSQSFWSHSNTNSLAISSWKLILWRARQVLTVSATRSQWFLYLIRKTANLSVTCPIKRSVGPWNLKTVVIYLFVVKFLLFLAFATMLIVWPFVLSNHKEDWAFLEVI